MALARANPQSPSNLIPTIKSEKDASPTCAVCWRPQCQLQSHRAYLAHRRRTTKRVIDNTRKPDEPKPLETTYARSYAYTRALPSLGAGRLDGFHDLPVPGGHQPELHHAVYSLLNSKMGAATAFPLPAGLAVNEIGGSMIIPVMTDTSLCLSVIAAWKAVQFLVGQSPEFPHLSYESQALQSLRQKLMDDGDAAITDEAILAAALLWATATMFAQPPALRRHASGVRALVFARKGLNTIGQAGSIGQAASIKQLILWSDFLTAQFLGEEVMFKDIGSPDPLPRSLVKIHRSIVIPNRFDCLLPETLKAARDLRLLLVSHDDAMRTGRLSIAEYRGLMGLLNQSTIERIGMEFQHKNSKTIDECVILAMNVLRLTVLFHAGPLFTIVVTVIGRLRKALSRIGVDHFLKPSGYCIDIYIWACFVGLVNIIKSENREHFMDMLSRALTIKYKKIGWPDDWQADILSILRSFLWSDAVLTDLYPEACQMIESHILSPGMV